MQLMQCKVKKRKCTSVASLYFMMKHGKNTGVEGNGVT